MRPWISLLSITLFLMKYNRDFCQTRILSKRDEGWKVKNFTAKNNSRTVQCFLKVLFRKKKSKYFHSRWKKESFRDSLINSQQSNQTDFNILVFFFVKTRSEFSSSFRRKFFQFLYRTRTFTDWIPYLLV